MRYMLVSYRWHPNFSLFAPTALTLQGSILVLVFRHRGLWKTTEGCFLAFFFPFFFPSHANAFASSPFVFVPAWLIVCLWAMPSWRQWAKAGHEPAGHGEDQRACDPSPTRHYRKSWPRQMNTRVVELGRVWAWMRWCAWTKPGFASQ